MKFLRIIIINIILIFSIIFITDDIVARHYLKNFKTEDGKIPPKTYLIKNIRANETSLEAIGREMPKIEDVDYTKQPIVLFGCSFAYGQSIDVKDTFSYKLSQLLKIPVINRALIAGGLQQMYYQTTQDDFYNLIPNCNNVIYILIDDHFRRALIDFFYIEHDRFLLHYSLKNNNFVMNNYNNCFLNLIRSLYITRKINHKWAQIICKNEKYKQYRINLIVKYFIESRKNLEKNWGNKVKFTVIIYQNIKYQEEIKNELEKNGFNVIQTEELTDADLEKPIYKIPKDGHPTGEAWTLLTPLIIDRLKQLNVL